jgi:hypothetical protein
MADRGVKEGWPDNKHYFITSIPTNLSSWGQRWGQKNERRLNFVS